MRTLLLTISMVLVMPLFFTDCKIASHKNFTYLDNCKNPFFRKAILSNGYFLDEHHYIYKTDDYTTNVKSGTTYGATFFYKDGSMATLSLNFHSKRELENYLSHAPTKLVKGHLPFMWGRYVVVGDTIKAQWMAPKESILYSTFEAWFLIVNESTLRPLKNFCSFCPDDEKRTDGVYVYEKDRLFRFTSFKNKPDSTNWERKRRWYREKGCRKNR